jgi:hypothetical protein
VTIEAPSLLQCRIENFLPLYSGQNHCPFAGIEAVHFCGRLIECWLPFVVLLLWVFPHSTASHASTQTIAGGCLGLLEEITRPRCPHPDAPLDKIGAAAAEKRH